MDAFEEIKQAEENLLCHCYSRYPLVLVRGAGSRLYDIHGNEYIDLLAGIAVCGLGHANPELCEVLDVQAHKLWHISNLFYQEEQLELARALLSTSHHEKAFFCNSGAEANEAAIKLARRYMRKVKQRDAYEIITLSGCFHGRTLGTLGATGRPQLQDGFGPMPAGFKQVETGNIEALFEAITPQTCAVLLECVQGEGGVVPLDSQYLRNVEGVCREKDILLLCDEVQCGLCRTGSFWAFEDSKIRPDAISIAKSLANGMPMGAMLATNELAKGFEPGSHASTFGGGNLTSAVAKKVIEIMLRDKLWERSAQLGEHLTRRLKDLQRKLPEHIREVRGRGLMLGIELGPIAPKVWKELLNEGFICNLNHNVTLRLLPPLTIAQEDLDKFVDTLENMLLRA